MSNPLNQITYNQNSGVLAVNFLTARKGIFLGGPIELSDDIYGYVTINGSLRVNGTISTLAVSYTNPTSVTVGSGSYPTIQSAIDSFAGGFAGNATIVIPPGTYNEQITLQNFSSVAKLQVRANPPIDNTVTNVINDGLFIAGDQRPFLPATTYIQGYRNVTTSTRGKQYQITTSSPASGPYTAFIASSFGAIGGAGPAGAQVANPLLANTPLVGFTPGNIALIRRGTVGFATKAKNAQNAGAVAAIIYNTQPNINTMGGTDASITIPAYSVSNADGVTLNNLITLNPGIQITITPVDPVYYPPLGTNYAYSQLSLDVTRTQLTISMAGPLPVADNNIFGPPTLVNPDFNHPSVGLVAGDKFILSDSDIFGNNSRSIHTVQSVLGNVITFTPAVDPVGSGGVDVTVQGANVTFLPNVCISPQYVADSLNRTLFKSAGVNFTMCGVWINQDVSQPFGNISTGITLGASSNCSLCNVVVSDIYGTAAGGWGIHFVDTSGYIQNGDTDRSGSLAVVGWAQGIGVSSRAILRYGNAFIGGTRQTCFASSMNANIGFENLQIMGCTGLFQPDAGAGIELGGGGNYHGSVLTVNKICDVADIYGPGIYITDGCRMVLNNPTLTVQRCSYPQGGTSEAGYGIHVDCGASFDILGGTYYATGQPFTQPGFVSNITDCNSSVPNTYPNIGIFVDDGGRFLNRGSINYSNNDLDALTVQTGQFLNSNDPVSPNNIYQYSSGGPTVMNPVFDQQEFSAGSAVSLTMNPSAVFNLNDVYVGRTYTIVSTNTEANTLTLPGAYFVVYGTSNKTVANFDVGNVSSMMTFRVESATLVRVIRSVGISFT